MSPSRHSDLWGQPDRAFSLRMAAAATYPLGRVGLRYRKTVRLSNRTRVNVAGRRASVSVGGPGLTANLSRRGVRTNVGLPGTGLSYVTKQIGGSRRRGSLAEELAAVIFIVILLGTVGLAWNFLCAIGGVFVKQRPRDLLSVRQFTRPSRLIPEPTEA